MAANRWIFSLCIIGLSSCSERVVDTPQKAENPQGELERKKRADALLKIYRESDGLGNTLDETMEKLDRHQLAEEAL